jgi:hypothetical protein
LGATYARLGELDEARSSLTRLDELAHGRPTNPFAQATILAMLGETEKVLDLLERAYEEHNTLMPFAPQYIFFTSLHGEPRFQAIVALLAMPTPPA